MIDFHRLIFIVIADDLPWPLLRKLGMHFSTLNDNPKKFRRNFLTSHREFVKWSTENSRN